MQRLKQVKLFVEYLFYEAKLICYQIVLILLQSVIFDVSLTFFSSDYPFFLRKKKRLFKVRKKVF